MDADRSERDRGRLTRRDYLRGIGLAALGAGAASLLFGADDEGGEARAVRIEAFLLTSEDFPESDPRQVQRLETRRTRDGGEAAAVVLETDRARIFHSVVVFPSERSARAMMQGIRAQAPSGGVASEQPGFGEESVVLTSGRRAERTASVVFRDGPAVVRLTLIGATDSSDLLFYGRKAEAKAHRARR